MDPELEFSTYQTREELEAEKRRWQESFDEFERHWAAERPASGNDSDGVERAQTGGIYAGARSAVLVYFTVTALDPQQW